MRPRRRTCTPVSYTHLDVYKRQAIALEAMREMMRQTDLEKRRQAAEKMRRDGLENNRQLRLRLTALGLPEDYLEEKHRCEKCRDTGYTDDIPARFCECFQKALRLRMFEDGTMAGLDRQNFAHFSDELVRKCNTPQEAQNLLFAKTIGQQLSLIHIYGSVGVPSTPFSFERFVPAHGRWTWIPGRW